jgi:hypothetical protein
LADPDRVSQMEALASALLTGTESWVGADGKPLGLSLNQSVAGQLEIGLDVRRDVAIIS